MLCNRVLTAPCFPQGHGILHQVEEEHEEIEALEAKGSLIVHKTLCKARLFRLHHLLLCSVLVRGSQGKTYVQRICCL